MKIGRFLFPTQSVALTVDEIVRAEEDGFHSVWLPQIFGWDPLTALALAGPRTSRLKFGTAVVPLYPTHPLLMAASAATTQSATDGRFTLGVGASHRFMVENVWGYDFDRPIGYTREYLRVLAPAMRGEAVNLVGSQIQAQLPRPLDLPDVSAPPVLLAALGERMLQTAGELCDGAVTWLTGVDTLGNFVVPTLNRAAAKAGRPQPTVVAGLPICVTSDASAARDRARTLFAAYTDVPSYRTVLDRERAAHPADVAVIGDETAVAAQVAALAAAGASEFIAHIFGTPEEQRRTTRLLEDLIRDGEF